MRYVN